MKSCVEEYRDYPVQELAHKYIEGELELAQTAVSPDEKTAGEQIKGAVMEDSTIHEGTVIYYIRFYALVLSAGEMVRLMINVEAQNDFYLGYLIIKRGIYYGSWMISLQYGVEFGGFAFFRPQTRR